MRSIVLSVTMAAVLMAAVVPGAFAADPATDAPAPAEAATPTPAPTPTGPFDGTIVVDPTFVSGGELPTQPPANAGAPRPGITPPPTDAHLDTTTTTDGTGLQVPLLLFAAAVAIAALVMPGRARRGAGRR